VRAAAAPLDELGMALRLHPVRHAPERKVGPQAKAAGVTDHAGGGADRRRQPLRRPIRRGSVAAV
jgi:hypothetical protein